MMRKLEFLLLRSTALPAASLDLDADAFGGAETWAAEAMKLDEALDDLI